MYFKKGEKMRRGNFFAKVKKTTAVVLGKSYTINKVTFNWEAAYAK